MKHFLLSFVVFFAFSAPVYAETAAGQDGMMMSECRQMPMMPMMMQEMVQTMKDMLELQEQMVMDMKPAVRQKMMKRLSLMKQRMDMMMPPQGMQGMGMMGQCMKPGAGMMGQGMMCQPLMELQGRVKCAEEWLKKAIDLHDVHIKDASTATEASQVEMMEQMKKAYECIAPMGMKEPLSEKPEAPGKKTEPSKADPHGH